MKRLVLLAEGQGDTDALRILIGKLLDQTGCRQVCYLDKHPIRATPYGLVKWNGQAGRPDCSNWLKRVELARRRRGVGAILAVYDGDFVHFPVGSQDPFCAWKAAGLMAREARSAGAGKDFSLAVVFACTEYESWLIASIESMAGRRSEDGRVIIPFTAKRPAGEIESHGKRWLQKVSPAYKPARDQAVLTEMLDLEVLRSKKLRSFQRLESALDQLLHAVETGVHISTPA